MTTIYTFHRAEDHAILATAEPGNVQQVAALVARSIANYPAASTQHGRTRRAYVHNGKGIVAAGLCRSGAWHDILRDDFMQCEPKARTARIAEGYHVDPVTSGNMQERGA